MTKRLFDLLLSLLILPCIFPLLLVAAIAVWLQDFKNPLYVAPRVAKNGGIFQMYKLRSMVANADKSGVDSTSANDKRITPVGRFLRKFKLDEPPQLYNVIKGDMSLVGPRPNVQSEVDLYTELEKRLLSVRPGITDLASIVFSDECEILKDSQDPDLDYNQLIRPWKSRLACFAIDHGSLFLDVKIILLTLVAVISRPKALRGIQKIFKSKGAPQELVRVAGRLEKLTPHAPMGTEQIVRSRK